ncbi:MAG: hypothetical protein PHH91_14405 [Desulfuromonadaceae bacterium]|nr:hypothetical protein [Desulfuromonadaceae bacterium]
MRHVIYNIFKLTLIILLMLPMPALAITAINCHCFSDRSYNPANPAASDPYLLATTQNSFFATVFNTDKKTVVMKKQLGTSPDDLWIAYWIASKTGISPDSLLQSKLESDSWKNVVVTRGVSAKNLGVLFSNALNANLPTVRLSEAVVEDLFLNRQLLREEDLLSLRKAGATNQELIIATVIATKTGQSARQLFLEVNAGTKSWGSLLSRAKIDTKNMQQEISTILNLHHQ